MNNVLLNRSYTVLAILNKMQELLQGEKDRLEHLEVHYYSLPVLNDRFRLYVNHSLGYITLTTSEGDILMKVHDDDGSSMVRSSAVLYMDLFYLNSLESKHVIPGMNFSSLDTMIDVPELEDIDASMFQLSLIHDLNDMDYIALILSSIGMYSVPKEYIYCIQTRKFDNEFPSTMVDLRNAIQKLGSNNFNKYRKVTYNDQ